MYFLYVLRSVKDNRSYIGSTNNLRRRLIEHNENQSKYTKSRGPWVLVYKEVYKTRSEAMKRERFFKSGKGREWLKVKS